MSASFRERAGCWAHERWRVECALRPCLARLTGIHWQDLCNRHERLTQGDGPRARVCQWRDSSWLTVARVFPEVASRLLWHCLAETSASVTPAMDFDGVAPRISVIVPVGGADRLPLLRACLRSVGAQTERRVDLIVAEYGSRPFCGALAGVPAHRHVYTACPEGAPFNKSRAMNAGVRAARAETVLLLDADAWIPSGFLAGILAVMDAGWEAVRPARWLFHLTDAATLTVLERGLEPGPMAVEGIQQNFPGIATACRREMYWRIGGHDERFEGWGGEDLEFLDRLATGRLFAGAYDFALHLWHPPAPKKASGDRNRELMQTLRAVPVNERIARLTGGAMRGGVA